MATRKSRMQPAQAWVQLPICVFQTLLRCSATVDSSGRVVDFDIRSSYPSCYVVIPDDLQFNICFFLPREQVSLHSMFTSCHREHLHTPFGNLNFKSVTESCAFYCYCFFCFHLTHWSSSVMLFFSWIELSFDTQPLQYKSHTNTTTTVHSYCCCCWSTLKLDNHFSFFLGLANPGYPKLQLVVVAALFLSSFLPS